MELNVSPEGAKAVRHPTLKFDKPITQGKLLRRYKRFLADIELPSGVITAHCANSGSMLGCNDPGSSVLVSLAENTMRKLPYSLEAVKVGRTWVGVNTSIPNKFVGELLRAKAFPPFAEYDTITAEATISKETRLDFLLESPTARPAFIEVKSVSYADGKCALFPDAVTARGAKHMRELTELVQKNYRAAVVFFVQRGDCTSFKPYFQVDPEYTAALIAASQAGVEIYPLSIAVGPDGFTYKGILPYELPLGLA